MSSETGVLRKFFGRKTPAQTLTEFAAELNALTPAEKTELAQLAAVELGEAPPDPPAPREVK